MDYFELYELKNSPRLTNTALGLTGESREVKKDRCRILFTG